VENDRRDHAFKMAIGSSALEHSAHMKKPRRTGPFRLRACSILRRLLAFLAP
jgi:hypothetical protein